MSLPLSVYNRIAYNLIIDYSLMGILSIFHLEID